MGILEAKGSPTPASSTTRARPSEEEKAWCGLTALPRHRPACFCRYIPGAGEAREEAAAAAAMRSRWLAWRAPASEAGLTVGSGLPHLDRISETRAVSLQPPVYFDPPKPWLTFRTPGGP